jgi:hypothetical protein
MPDQPRRYGGIQSVATAVAYEESRSLSLMAVRLDVTKYEVIRGVIRFALSKGPELFQWLEENREEWVRY